MAEVFKKADEMQVKGHGLTYFRGCRAGAIKEYDECHDILKNLLDEQDLGIWEEKILDAICHYAQNAKNFDNVAIYAEKLIEFLKKNDFAPAAYSYVHLFRAHKGLGNLDKAAEALLQGLEVLPNNERLLTELGYHYENTNSPEKLNTWTRLMEVAPKNAVPYNRIAILYRKENKNQEALDVVNQGLEAIPGSINLLGRRGYIYFNMNEYQKAIDDFLLVAENPQRQNTWWEKGTMYYEAADILASNLNDAETATKYYFLAQEHGGINTDRKKAHFAYVYIWSKEYEKAIAIFDECINSDPKDDYYVYTRGDVYKRMGEHAKAKADFDKVLEMVADADDTSHNAYRFVGYAHLEMGRPDEAKVCFEKAQEAIKTDGTRDGICFCIPQNWARYYRNIGDYQKALEQIELAIGITNSVWNNELKREIMREMQEK